MLLYFFPGFSLYQTPLTSVFLGALQILNSNWWKAARHPDRASRQAPRRRGHKAAGCTGEREGRVRSPPGGRPASPEPAPRREQASETPAGRPLGSAPPAPSPAEPRTASPGGRAGSTAPTRAPRGASEVWTRKYMGRPAAARARERAGGGLRRSLPHRHSSRDLSQPPRRAAPPSPRSRRPAGLRSTLLTCWTRTRAHPRPPRRSPPRPHGRAARGPVTSWRSPAAEHAGVPGLGGGPGGVGPSVSARALRLAAARTHLPAAAPRRVIGCPRAARQIEPSIHSWAGRARAAAKGLGPARAPPRSRASPPTAAALPGASSGPMSAHGPRGPAALSAAASEGRGLSSSRLSRAPWVALSTSDGDDSPRWLPQPRARCGELRAGLAIGERLGRRRAKLRTHRSQKVRVTPPSCAGPGVLCA